MEILVNWTKNIFKKTDSHNFVVNVIDVSLYQLGMHIISVSVVLPMLLYRLGASELIIAMLPALAQACTSLPQLLSSFFIEKAERMKPTVMFTGILQRLPFLILALLLPTYALSHPNSIVIIFLILFILSSLTAGLGQPAWNEMIAKAIPIVRRGQFMAHILFWVVYWVY